MNRNRPYARLTCLGLSALLSACAVADTAGPWSNTLLRAVPASAKGLVSIDLSGSTQPLSSVLSLVENASGKTFGQNASQALKMLKLPQAVTDDFAKATDRRAVLYFDPGASQGMTQALVLVLGLKPGQGMSTVVKASDHEEGGVKYADFDGVEAHVEGNLLMLTSSAKNFAGAVKPLHGGPHISVASLSRVSDAIESASEVVAWVDSDIAASAPVTGKNFSAGTGKSFGFSLGLHPKGISISAGPLTFGESGKPMDLSSLRPLPSQYLNTLPGGAYFVTCIANPWPAAEHFHLTENLTEQVGSSLDSLKNLIRGDYVLGLYPSTLKKGTPNGIDLLVELRPNEGNNPAAQLQKLMKTVTKALIPGDEPVFDTIHVEGADHAYRLNKALASLLHLALRSALESTSGAFDSLIQNKNLVVAGVGHNVVFATSEPVLRKAVAALKFGASPLAADPKFSEMTRDNGRPTQFVLAASLTRIVNFVVGVAGMASKGGVNLGSAGGAVNQFSSMLAHWPDPLMLRLSVSHSGLSARAFLPIGFEALASSLQSAGKPTR